jgi:hypothetical protein
MTKVFEPIQTGGAEKKLFARLKLVPSRNTEKLTRDLMLKRRTSRLHFDGKLLNKETLNRIHNQAAFFNHEFFSSSDEDLVNYIINLNQETLFKDISSKDDCKELDHLFRYSSKEAKKHKDGLWSKCMGFPGYLMKSVFRHPEKWDSGVRRDLLAKKYKSSFKGTATICWFGGAFANTEDWLQAGRMLARNWLLITKENAYIHPFGSLVTNPEAYEKINKRFTQPGSGKKIWMIFRAGYSKLPTRSFRLSTEEIIFN